jgi:hypothetical protein
MRFIDSERMVVLALTPTHLVYFIYVAILLHDVYALFTWSSDHASRIEHHPSRTIRGSVHQG